MRSPAGVAGAVAFMALVSCNARDVESEDTTTGEGLIAATEQAPPGREDALPVEGREGHVAVPSIDQPCDEVAAGAHEDGNLAVVPIVEGLTLAATWWGEAGGDDDYEHECLTHVVRADAREVVFSSSCPVGRERALSRGVRRICRADLERSSLHVTGRGGSYPEMVAGSTADILSRASFRELSAQGSTWLRAMSIVRQDPLAQFLDLARAFADGAARDESDAENAPDLVVQADASGIVRVVTRDTEQISVNGRLTALPVLRLAGRLDMADGSAAREWRLAVLDDERAPWVLDNHNETTKARVRIDRITYPVAATLEHELGSERAATLHGVFFELGSDALREESMAALAQAAEVLRRHPDWRLAVHGHTDNAGGNEFNQQLSERRAAAVRRVLVERFAIDAARLEVRGFGASQPQGTNDTPQGRARNRRVELVRQ